MTHRRHAWEQRGNSAVTLFGGLMGRYGTSPVVSIWTSRGYRKVKCTRQSKEAMTEKYLLA
eukprot:766828-Pleurochrysis_carterae.AAC.6